MPKRLNEDGAVVKVGFEMPLPRKKLHHFSIFNTFCSAL
jgi:hypothetical protein